MARLSVARLTDTHHGGRWRRVAPVLLWLTLGALSCSSEDSGQAAVSRTITPSSSGAVLRTGTPSATPSGTPTPVLPTRDFDGTVKGEGSQVFVRSTPDTSGEAIGACADGARLHVGDRTANGLWFNLAWDPGNPPASCYSFTGHEHDRRSSAYIGAAFVAPVQLGPTQAVPASSASAPGGATAIADPATQVTSPSSSTDRISPPSAPATSTVGIPRTPVPTLPPYALGAEGPPTCAATADGQFLIRWTVTEANGQLLAGMAIAISGPGGQTIPAVLRAGATPGSQVGTGLVGAAGSYHLVASMPNADGSSAHAEASVVCGGLPQAPNPTDTATTLPGASDVPLTPSVNRPAGLPGGVQGTPLPQSALTPSPSSDEATGGGIARPDRG